MEGGGERQNLVLVMFLSFILPKSIQDAIQRLQNQL